MDKRFFLIGFMTSGKSSLGKKLAAHFNFNFIDLDEQVEALSGKTIAEIFSQDGEAIFRKLESEALRNLPAGNSFVATGGGTPCFNSNIDWMKENGIVIYLKLPAEMLIGRLRQNKQNRPLVASLSDEELVNFVNTTLPERRSYYEQADITFPPDRSWALIKTDLHFIIHINNAQN